MTTTERNLERLAHDTKNIVRDTEELLKGIPEDLGEEAKKARKRLAATLESARETYQRLEKRAVAGLRATDEVVHEKPYPFIGVAFGLGLLVGVLVGRR